MKDVIIDECELSIAANNIQRQVDKMIDVMSQYNKILADLQKNGIQDNHISAQFSEIAQDMAFCGEHLRTNISNIGQSVNCGIDRVAVADKFVFPGDFLDEIIAKIASLIF